MPKKQDRTADAFDLLKAIAAEFNTDIATLRAKTKLTRSLCYTRIRRIFAERGRAAGLSTLEMGIALNRDHTTMSYHANPALRLRKDATRPPYRYIPRSERKAAKSTKTSNRRSAPA